MITVSASLLLTAACVAAVDPTHYAVRGDFLVFHRHATDDDVAVLDAHPEIGGVAFETGPWDGPVDPRDVPIEVTNRGFAYLARCKKLHTLRLSFMQPLRVTDAGLKSLAGLKELRVLQLGVTPFSNRGLAHIAKLPQLEELWLDFNSQCDDGAMETIADLKTLRVLRFYGAPLTDKGVAKLAGLSRLEDLQLGRSQVGDAGLKTIASLGRLKTLDLQHTRVTDAGMRRLTSLRKLEWLCLKGTAVTRKGLAQLVDLPNLKSLYLDESQAENLPEELAAKVKGTSP